MAAKRGGIPKLGYPPVIPTAAIKGVAPRAPSTGRVQLSGTAASRPVVIPAGLTVIMINPLTTTVEVQVAFQVGESNTTGKFFTLQDGQPVELRTNAGEVFQQVTMEFFAASAVDVDVVAF